MSSLERPNDTLFCIHLLVREIIIFYYPGSTTRYCIGVQVEHFHVEWADEGGRTHIT